MHMHTHTHTRTRTHTHNQLGETKWLHVKCVLIVQERDVYFDGGYQKSRVYLLEKLSAGHTLQGPAIIIDKNRSA